MRLKGRPRINHPDYSRGRDGIYLFRVPKQGTARHKWISTGAPSLERAQAVVREAGADRLVLLARARTITHDAIAIIMQGRRVNSSEVVQGWVDWLQRRNAPETIRRYRLDVVSMLNLYGAMNNPLTIVSEANVYDFVNQEGVKLSTRQVRLASLLSFYRYAQGNGYVIGNPAVLVDIDRRAMSVTDQEAVHFEPMTEAEYMQIVHPLEGRVKQFYKDITVIGWCCGLRMSDVCQLEWASFTRDEIVIYVKKHHSGGKRLVLPMSDPLVMRPELRELIDRLLAAPDRHPRFVWPDRARSFRCGTSQTQSNKYSEVLQKLGIQKTFHCLRAAAARRWREAGRSLEDVARTLAHASTDTTRVYTGESSTSEPAPTTSAAYSAAPAVASGDQTPAAAPAQGLLGLAG